MAKKYRKCLLCEKEYLYCSGCAHDKTKPTWMSEFHEENCKTIFQACTDFNMKFLTKDAAKEVLSKCDLSNKSNFRASVQKTLTNIFAEDEKPAEKEVKVEKKPAPAVQKAAKAPVAPKAAKTPVVEKTEIAIVPEKTEVSSEVVNKTEDE